MKTTTQLVTKAYRDGLTAGELDSLWSAAHGALCGGRLADAVNAVDALLYQAQRGLVCPDMLPTVGSEYGALADGLRDRITSLNGYVERR